jgi:putative hydrolase of the HAD superfamily
VTGWRAIGFDLDDTLYPERAFVLSGFEAVAGWIEAEVGLPKAATARELTDFFSGGVRGDTFDRWLKSHDLPVGSYRERMVEVYRRHAPRLAAYPDVVPSLQRLWKTYRLGLATEGPAKVQHAKLDALGLRGLLQRVVILGEGDRARWKPDPWPLERLADALRVAPGEMVYVGDNPAKDFLAARRAGMTGVRIRRPDGLHSAEEPLAPEDAPDGEVTDLPGLEAWLVERGAAQR